MVEARGKLAAFDSVTYAESLGSVESESFDYVFCLEVLEHLPAKETIAAIAEIHRLLKPAGAAVIGVPHELFLPALVKGLFRVSAAMETSMPASRTSCKRRWAVHHGSDPSRKYFRAFRIIITILASTIACWSTCLASACS
jgi:predicted SAM-dependent methyltransferase